MPSPHFHDHGNATSKSYACVQYQGDSKLNQGAKSHLKKQTQNDNSDGGSQQYNMRKIDFVLMESESLITSDNTIEVKLLLDNRTDFDWPEDVHVRGKSDCPITAGVDHVLVKRVKRCSLKVVKFSFPAPPEIPLEKETAVFELFAFDTATNTKYFSDDISAVLKKKKNAGLFNFCRILS